MRHHILLSVLVLREGDDWIAQALERDFAAHGRTPDEALNALKRTIVGHLRMTVADTEPLANVPPAPQVFWDTWSRIAVDAQVRPLIPPESDLPPAWIVTALESPDSRTSR